MKGFMKFCAIAALSCLLSGAVLIAAGSSALGGGAIAAAVEKATGGRVSFHFSDWKEWGISLFNRFPFVNRGWEDAPSFSKDHPTQSGDVAKHRLEGTFSRIDVEAGGCTFDVRDSGDGCFYVEATKADEFQAYVEDGTLYVKSGAKLVFGKVNDKSKVVFYVPAGHRFDGVRMELGAGTMSVGNLRAGEASIEAGAGEILVSGAEVDWLELSVGMGNIELEGMNVNRLNVSVGMGAVTARGSVSGNVRADCSMGSVELTLEGSRNDFNYDLDCSMGTIWLDGEEYGGMGMSKAFDNGAGKSMEADCSMGEVTIRFVK